MGPPSLGIKAPPSLGINGPPLVWVLMAPPSLGHIYIYIYSIRGGVIWCRSTINAPLWTSLETGRCAAEQTKRSGAERSKWKRNSARQGKARKRCQTEQGRASQAEKRPSGTIGKGFLSLHAQVPRNTAATHACACCQGAGHGSASSNEENQN